jgi:hypothetical protein
MILSTSPKISLAARRSKVFLKVGESKPSLQHLDININDNTTFWSEVGYDFDFEAVFMKSM